MKNIINLLFIGLVLFNQPVVAQGYYWPDSSYNHLSYSIINRPDNFTYYTNKCSVLQPDGKLILGGDYDRYGTNLTTSAFILHRFKTDGTLDSTFGINGIVTDSIPGMYSFLMTAVAVKQNGNIAILGTAGFCNHCTSIAAAEYLSNGSLNTAYGNNGHLTYHPSVLGLNTAVLLNDTQWLVGGRLWLNTAQVAKFKADLTPDSSFGVNGINTTSLGTYYNEDVYTLKVLNNGKILVGGIDKLSNSTAQSLVYCLKANGTIDSSFGTNGATTRSIHGIKDVVHRILIQADGKIVVCGDADNSSISSLNYHLIFAYRLLSNGAIDNSFGTGVYIYNKFSGVNVFADAVQTNDGHIIMAVGGRTAPAQAGKGYFIMLTANGSPDVALGDGLESGIIINGTDETAVPNAMQIQSDGALLISGAQSIQLAGPPGIFAQRFSMQYPLGVQNIISKKSELTVFPNPIGEAGIITVSSASGFSKIPQFKLYSATGQELSSLVVLSNTAYGNATVQVALPANLSNGFYYIKDAANAKVCKIEVIK